MSLPDRPAAHEVPVPVPDHGSQNIHYRDGILSADPPEERQQGVMQLGSIQDVLVSGLLDP